MDLKIPTPVAIGIAVVVLALVGFFAMRLLNSTAPGVPDELAAMQAEAEARRSPGYEAEKAKAAGQAPQEPMIQPGFSPGRQPEGQ